MSLKDKRVSMLGHYMYPEEDVKAAIKELKEDYNLRLDNIQNSFETTSDPIIAKKRLDLMIILCGFIDEIDKIMGEDLI